MRRTAIDDRPGGTHAPTMVEAATGFPLESLAQAPPPVVLLLAALALDALTGNVAFLRRFVPQPVHVVAALVDVLDRRLNRPERGPRALVARGVLVVGFVAVGAAAAGWVVEAAAARVPYAWLLAWATIGALIAQRGPFDEARRVAWALGRGRAGEAVDALAVFAGRSPGGLSEAEAVRTSVAHLAAQLVDGLAAAAFWYLLLGLPGLAAWRAINVAGRRLAPESARNAYFGWAPSRISDALAWVPGAMAGTLTAAGAAFVPSAAPRRAFAVMLRDGAGHRRLSHGWSLAAMAGALGIALDAPRLRQPGGRSEPVGLHWVGAGPSVAEPRAGALVRALYLYAVAALMIWLAVILVAVYRLAGE
jgi:adenosylcobinamide-phosphate synthase